MSLHKFAQEVASKGRGEDSLLIHMTPDEVQRLQAFAQANGRSLTINPDTGLPEAGMLSDLFKMVAPIALGAFLGPGAFGIAGMGLSAGTAGLVTGGLTTLATGSLSRGLMAGLGAYGGAGLAQGFADAGVGAGMSEALAGSSSGNLGQAFGDVAAAEGSSGQAFNEFLKSSANPATMSGTELAASGFKAAATDPMAFAKQNFGNIAAAAAPIMAGAMVPTTTKMPGDTSPAYIRQKLYDPYTQTYKTLAPVKASEFGNRSFSDAYTNPQTGIAATLAERKPTFMAGGGIVALAGGGIPGYADGALVSDQQIFDYFKSGPKSDEQVARDMGTYNVTTADIARATGTQSQQADYDKRFAVADTKNDIYDYFAKPETQTLLTSGNDKAIADTLQANDWKLADVAAATGTQNLLGDYGTRYVKSVVDKDTDANEFLARASDVGLTGQPLTNALQNSGLSAAAQYALTHSLDDTKGLGPEHAAGKPFYDAYGYTAGSAPGDQGGLEGLYANINYAVSELQNKINSGALTVEEAQRLSDAEMRRIGVSMGDVKAATGKDLFSLFKPKTELKKDDKTTVTGGTGKDTITGGTGNDTFTTVTPPPFTSVIPTGFYGNATNPGDITTNKDGTVTVHPNIPYRPTGGFSGMGEVRDAYTKGGGSLGYTSKAPKTIKEFNDLYNKQTGDSLAAYDYLMGKGGGKYPVQSTAASTAEGIMRPYFSAGMKYKPKFLSYDDAGNVVSSSTNPNAPQSKDAKVAELTRAKTIEVVDSSGYNTETYTAVLQEDGTYLAGNGKRYDVTGKQIAAGGGMMGYASGGITGDGNLNLNIPLNIGGGGGGYTPMGGGFSSGGGGYSGGFSGQNNTAGDGFGGRPPPTFSSTNTDTTRVPGPLHDLNMPVVDYSPFSEEGRRKRAEQVELGRAGGVTATGPMPGFDYGSGVNTTTTEDMMGGRKGPAIPFGQAMSQLGFGMANGGMTGYAMGGGLGSLGSYSDGGRLLKGPGDGVSDSIPATIGRNRQPARLADGEFVIPARIVSELGNGSTEAGAKKLYAMMDRVQRARRKTTGKNKVAANSRADKYLPA
jgi:hypothetical protein